MKTFLICTLLFVYCFSSAQYFSYSGKKIPKDFSLISYVHWRQLGGGPLVTTIVNPDSLTTRVLNINRAGTYQYELTITFSKSGLSTTVRDTVRVISSPPLKDSVFVVQKFSTSKSVEIVSRIQSIAKIQVFNGTTIVQNYSYTAYAGLRIVFVTGICSGCVLKVTLNNKVYTL